MHEIPVLPLIQLLLVAHGQFISEGVLLWRGQSTPPSEPESEGNIADPLIPRSAVGSSKVNTS